MSLNRKEFLKLTGAGLGGALVLGLPAAGEAAAGGDSDAGNHAAMLYDTTLCIGCRACQTACREWNQTTVETDLTGLYDAPQELSGDTWTLIQIYEGESERSFVKHQCMHCLHPACVSACPARALEKAENGPVVYDAKRCIGCRYCMVACPFRVPRYEWDEVLPKIVKCTFCSDRLAVGDGPNCAEWCPVGALIWGTRDELITEAERRLAAEPDRYVNHIYGLHDAGGTSVLYLSHVPFEKIGLPELGDEPMPGLSERMGSVVLPGLIVGVPILLAGIRYLKRKEATE